jgi:uncharacterized protein YfaS (alpha-2-macroglobulin family)
LHVALCRQPGILRRIVSTTCIERLAASASCGRAVRLVLAVTLCTLAQRAPAADTASVEQFVPQGTVKQVRQVTARFSEPMVPFGDPRRLNDPFEIDCTETGTGRWIDSRTWVYEFARDLPGGVRCTFLLRDGLATLSGAKLSGERSFGFSTGGPAIRMSIPAEGDERIDEDQAFIVVLDAEAEESSVLEHAWFRVDSRPERIGTRIVTGDARESLLSSQGFRVQPGPTVVLQAVQRFPSATGVSLVWGEGIMSPSGVATEREQVLQFVTRAAFTANPYCERANPEAECIPLTTISLGFSAPVAWEQARRIELTGPENRHWSPQVPDHAGEFVSRLEFVGPFPEATTLRLEIPDGLTDDAGRPLANAAEFPMALETDPYPPLAKFSARFGIIERKGDATLPVTLRNLEAEVAGRREIITAERTSATLALLLRGLMDRITGTAVRIPPDRLDLILPWLQRVGSAKRSESVFGSTPDPTVQSFQVPKPNGPKAFEVVGIPLERAGLYVVELSSLRLGAYLLGKQEPMYVPTAALVTNLAVHFKWGRDNALAWVTSLEKAAPVAGARVSLLDCKGTVLWNGVTDADGLARIDGLPDREAVPYCNLEKTAEAEDYEGGDFYDDSSQTVALDALNGGLLVVAQTPEDISFVHSSWSRGIEPWRFQLPPEDWQGPIVAHTIFDRTLFRAGETVHMKHVLRNKTMAGFALVAEAEQPTGVSIRHEGSNERYDLELNWDAQGAAENVWEIPRTAKLGRYQVTLTGPPGGRSSDRISGTFRVEEFRVPLLRATVQLPPTPQVAVSSVPVDISIQYLAGGTASRLPVLLRSQVRPRSFRPPPEMEHFAFGNGPVTPGIVRLGVLDEKSAGAGVVQRQDLVLDAAGSAHATVTELPPGETLRELLAEIEFRDPNGEGQTVAATVPLWPARWLTGIFAEQWMTGKTRLAAKVAVVDTEGKPVRGALARVDMLPRKTYSSRKRLVGGFYAYDHYEETGASVGQLCEGRTDERGLLFCEGPSPVDGSLVLQASVTDDAGHTSAAHTEVWVAGTQEWWFGVGNADRIDLLPERSSYQPGETARLQVRMPFRQATALVTVEREGVLSASVVALSGNEPLVEVPLSGDYAPNVFVSVLAVRGRVGGVQPTAMVDLGKPSWKLGIAELRVGWQAHQLTVGVNAERPVYRVREQADVRISVRTSEGRPPPVGSDVAVAAVDEGLLELQPNGSWDLLAAMMGRRGYSVRTSTAQMQVVGKRHYGLKALPLGGGGGRQATRELFDTLLFWQAHVPLDADGNASVRVPLNDSLTSFRIVAVATGGVGQFGTGATAVRSTQDLMLFAGLPPVVREGDVFRAEFTARNTTDQALPLTMSVTVDGLAEPLVPQQLRLPPGESAVVGWDVRVPVGVQALTYDIEAASGTTTDHLRVTQVVRPAVPVRTVQATVQRLEQPIAQRLERPADALPDRGELDVTVAPTLASGLDGVRHWMRRYPYTCLEQRVSRAVALRDADAWADIAAALPSFADADGLLKYFPTTSLGSEVLTAYVLAVATQAALPIPDDVRAKMEAGLTAFIQGSLSRTSPVQTVDLAMRKLAAVAALAAVGKATPPLLDSIAIEPDLWPTSAVLDWWSILESMPALPARDMRLRAAEQVIRSRLDLQGTTMNLSTEAVDRLWWLMVCPDTNAVRLLLQTLKSGIWRDDVPRLLRGALARQRRGHWDCTVSNAWGTLAIDAFSRTYEGTAVSGSVSASLGENVQRATWVAPQDLLFQFPWPAGQSTLSVQHDGAGVPWLSIAARAAIPLTEPLSSGYRITKVVTPVEPRQAGPWRRGDLLSVRLDIDAQSDMTWVVVDDPVPAGSSHLGTGLERDSRIQVSATPAVEMELIPVFVERAFEAFRAYYDYVPKGRFSVEYTIRLNQSGTFELPPTRVEALYAPEMFGESPNAPVEVQP